MNNKVSNEILVGLIGALQEYKDKGIIDPWVLGDGSIIEPLDVLIELREARLELEAAKDAINNHG